MLRIVFSIKLRTILIFLVSFFVLATTCYGSVSQYASQYKTKKYYSLLSTIKKAAKQRNRAYTLTELYILYYSYLQTGQITKANHYFHAIQASSSVVVRRVTYNTTMSYLYSTKSYDSLISLFHVVLNEHDAFLNARVLVLLYDTFKHYTNKPKLAKTLRWFFLNYPKFQKDQRLMLLYLQSLPKGSNEYKNILLKYWVVASHSKFKAAYRKQLKQVKIYKTTSAYFQDIIEHMRNQLRYREYKYIQQYVPIYLKKFPNVSEKQIQELQDIFFRSFVYKSHWYRMIWFFQRTQNYNMFHLTPADVISWQAYAYLKVRSITKGTRLVNLLKSKGYKDLDRHYHLLADYWLEHDKYDTAKVYLERMISSEKLRVNQLADNNWYLFQMYNIHNNKKGMENIIDWAEGQRFHYAADGARFCYWAIQKKLGNRDANDCYSRYPYSYYGIVSKYKTNSNGALLNSPKWSVPSANISDLLTQNQKEELNFILFMYLSNNNKSIDKFITWRLPIAQGKAYFIELCKVLSKTQNYYQLYNLSTSIFKGNKTIYKLAKEDDSINDLRRIALTYSYPKVYFNLVLKYAKESNVSPYLILAVMRAESNFRYYVRSNAGALGLLQLMYSTAREVGRKLHISVTRSKLLKPEVNLRIGAYYLHTLLRYYKGNLYYTIAAYNAGYGRVRKWRKSTAGKQGKNYFVESIRFDDTRNYVKHVLQNYYIYQFLYK